MNESVDDDFRSRSIFTNGHIERPRRTTIDFTECYFAFFWVAMATRKVIETYDVDRETIGGRESCWTESKPRPKPKFAA